VTRNTDLGDRLVGGGEMGKLVRSMDWGKTPLGPIESWPQSLRTTVGLCLASNLPISLAWGPRHVQIYNDSYLPICGGKHPRSMGQDFSECWASAWPAIGEAFESALAGETCYVENQRMFLDRHGYLEETFFTFSFSPIRDESGCVGGLFHPVTETTIKIVGERRTRAIRDLAARSGEAQSTEEALMLAARTMSGFELDLPFAIFYLLNAEGTEARLIAQTESVSRAITIPTVNLEAPQCSAWPLSEVARSNQAQQVDDLEARFGSFSCGPYSEPPKTALVLPITPPGCTQPLAILVVGVSSRLPLTEAYHVFYDLLLSRVTWAVAHARASGEERKRAEALAEIDRAKTAFFSNVSHEFRTPLTLMLGPLEDELAERASPLPAARSERLEMAHRNTLRLLKLVNTLLDFSRIEAGSIDASYEAIDLAAYTAELAGSFRSAVEKAGLILTVNCPPLPEPVYVDKDMWERVVLNLLSNAFRHTFKGGIRVTLRWTGDHAEMDVTDSGVGIPESEMPGLFDRFHRGNGAKSRTDEGTGIGLALVQKLIREHGGSVRVESQEGKGSTFTVVLKAGHAHLPPESIGARRSQDSTETRTAAYVEEALQWVSDISAASQPLPPPVEVSCGVNRGEAETASAARARILWADDNADMRDYVRGLLSDRYDVTAVADEGLEGGSDDYLVKRFSARELLARVRTHLKLAKQRRQLEVELELQVQESTAELLQMTSDLEMEVAERKRTEEALRESEQSYRTVTETAPDAMITIDEDGSIVFVNRAAERIFGHKTAEMLGESLTMLMPEFLGPVHQASFKRYFETRRKHTSWHAIKLHGVHKGGEEIPLEISFSEFVKCGKRYFTGIARDITERKHLEDQLRQSQKMEAVGHLAGGVAHDFNNMLTAIIGYSQLIQLRLDQGSRLSREVGEIEKAGRRAASLTSQLLAFSRKQVLQPKVIDLNEAISDIDKMLRRLIGENIDHVTIAGPELGRVKADPGQLEQILVNLALNSRDAMPQGGKLTIETMNVHLDEDYASTHAEVVAGQYVMLAVSDTGHGMDAKTMSRIFEPFFTTKERGRGTGLGLSMVYGIVKQSGGHVWVYSEPGQGTTFKIYLPTIDEAVGAGDVEMVASGALLGSETILLVEDEEMVREFAHTALETYGYTVLEAASPVEALEVSRGYSGLIHLMLTDIIMPGITGRELTERLSHLRPEMKVLYMSGYTDDAIVRHGVLDADTPFLQKPFAPDMLARKARQVLDSHEPR
jgi:PAS domain S-box-containing protein